MKTNYTVGFLFNKSLTHVALIRKMRPNWQRGRLNGIGGHLEPNENPSDCMTREFDEEISYHPDSTGKNQELKWVSFGELEGGHEGNGFKVFLFAAIGDFDDIRAKTDEVVEIESVRPDPLRADIIENVPWMISLAIDTLVDGRPVYTTVKYP